MFVFVWVKYVEFQNFFQFGPQTLKINRYPPNLSAYIGFELSLVKN